ncbi:MAG: glycosyltransferase [Chloroflexota bacterium]
MSPRKRPRRGPAQRTRRQASISACLIVKNEEQNLQRCLDSLHGKVDEIVVVDTGSTDGTLDLVRANGLEAGHFAWCDDFSAARNASLALASGDWIIWIDADEELIEHVPGALRHMCEQLPAQWDGCWVPSQSLASYDGEIGVVARQWRVFRNHRGIIFHGRIHEQLELPHGAPPRLAGQEAVVTRHWGYLPSGDLLARKAERNLGLLAAAIRDKPDDPRHHFNLGLQYSFGHRWDEALAELERGIELWRRDPRPVGWVPGLFASAAFVAIHLERYALVAELEQATPPEFLCTDLVYFAGVAAWRLGRVDDAIVRLRRAAEDPSILHEELHQDSLSTWRPLALLGGIYDKLGQPETAYSYATRAVALAPDHPELLFGAADLAHKAGQQRESLGWLRQLLAGSRDSGYKAHGRRLMLTLADELGSAETALDALDDGPAFGVSEAERMTVRTRALAHLGRQVD